jgi:hypothetical protein
MEFEGLVCMTNNQAHRDVMDVRLKVKLRANKEKRGAE